MGIFLGIVSSFFPLFNGRRNIVDNLRLFSSPGGQIEALFFILLLFSSIAFASSDEIWNRPDWSREVFVNRGENRENIYQLSDEKFKEFVKSGKLHALVYPDVTRYIYPLQSDDPLHGRP